MSSAATVIVVEGACCGAEAPAEIKAACARLSELSATELLGVGFELTGCGEWIFNAATPFPELRLGENRLLDLLFQSLS